MTDKITGVHHVALGCKDPEGTKAFYEDLLGLTEAFSSGGEGWVEFGYELANGSQLVFFKHDQSEGHFPPKSDMDLHVALEVESAAAQDELVKKLKVAGFAPYEIADRGVRRSVYFRDPNGLALELTALI